MASSSSTEAQMKSEIERLTGLFSLGHFFGVNLCRSNLDIHTTATINQHKALQKQQSTWDKSANHYAPYHRGGLSRNKYVNPDYQPPNKYVRPGLNPAGPSITTIPSPSPSTPSASSGPSVATISQPPPVIPGQVKEVVLGGVAFESSGRSLVRKDCE